jgi:hypothetical protein
MTPKYQPPGTDHPPAIHKVLDDLKRLKEIPTAWDYMVERLLNGLRDPHLYFGRAVKDGMPWLLQRDLLHSHGHALGGTRTGKTALCLAPLAFQLIAHGDSSVVIIDLKGDRALFWGSFIEARDAGLPMRWFTIEPGSASYLFEPFSQSHERRRTLNARAQALQIALGMYYGEGHGRSYFQAFTLETIAAFFDRFPGIQSFADFSRYADQPGSYVATNTDEEQSRHLRMVLRQLATVSPLNAGWSAGPNLRPEAVREAIDLTDVLMRPQVVYFNLPSMEEELTARAIGRLVLYSLVHAAQIVNRTGKPRPVFVIVDEAQQVLGESIRVLLEMARSMGVYFIFAHQSVDQLRTAQWDIRSTIESCTTFKIMFESSSLASLKDMEEYSGLTRIPTFSHHQVIAAGFDENDDAAFSPARAYPTHAFAPPLGTVGEVLGPVFNRNEILAASAHPLRAYVRSRSNGGLTQYAGRWTEIECEYPMTKKEYDARLATPWPAEHPACITVTAERPAPTPHKLRNGPLPVTPPRGPVDEAIAERLRRLRTAVRPPKPEPPAEA